MQWADTKDADSKREGDSAPPPPYTPSRPPPPSGYRIPLEAASPFPSTAHTKEPPCRDSDGSPVFVGSAIFNNSVHPCKVGAHLVPPCRVPFGGSEIQHYGRYDLLPFDKEAMEWVPTSLGRIPAHRHPVPGGYEESGAHLYHAMATVRDTRVPGKTGEHLVSRPLHPGLPSTDRYLCREGVMWLMTGWSTSSLGDTTYCTSSFGSISWFA